MKNLFDYPQEYFIAYEMDLMDAYLFYFFCHHSKFFQSEFALLIPVRNRDVLLTHLSALGFKRRGLDQRLQSLNRKMMILCHEHDIAVTDERLNDIDVFGYPISVMEQYELDIKDMLILHWINESSFSKTLHHKRIHDEIYTYLNHKLFISDYPIVHMSESSLRNRIHALIEKGLIQRHMEYCAEEKVKRCYYRIANENLCQSLSMQTTVEEVKNT